MQKAAYRIIDANFNRAREALRVIEDFSRFSLNSPTFTERTRQMRHRLSATVSQIHPEKQIASRNTTRDVGTRQTVPAQLKRKNLEDSLTAAFKRLPEALRVLAETIQPVNPEAAEKTESIRYETYTLEKDISIISKPLEKFKNVNLYIVINTSLPADALWLTENCIAGGADCIQLRAKNITDRRLLVLAKEFVNLCKNENTLSIINDRTDIAIAAQADGIHLGCNDIPIEEVRNLQLSPLIIGTTTHTPEELKSALQKQPAYVSLGPVFKTPTKPDLKPAGIDYLEKGLDILKNTPIAHAAIGGINLENIEKVLHAGARTIAVSSFVTRSTNPKEACRLIKQKITSFKPNRPSQP